MIVQLNGERREVPSGTTVATVVELLSGAPDGARGVAVAVGGQVVPRGQWPSTQLSDGDSVEIVAAIQGG